MHSPEQNASTVPASSRSAWRIRPVDDVIYQVVTVGAILLVLGSLWLF
jgi:hypothetical protein